jgi:hypothetical protein
MGANWHVVKNIFLKELGKRRRNGVSVYGQVQLVDPAEKDVHVGHPRATRREGESGLDDTAMDFLKHFNDPRGENAIPDDWIEEWARRGRKDDSGRALVLT